MKNITVLEKAIKFLIKNRVKNANDLAWAKREIAKRFKINPPPNVKLIKAYHNLIKNKRLKNDTNLEAVLKKRKIRSLSGVVNVSVLTKPYPCPGKCIYCPNKKDVPKSYLEDEPAVQRAISNNFNPYLQVRARLKSLNDTGHPTDKIELRIIGGTWSFYPKKYQTWFIKKCFEAANQKKSKTLKEAQKTNEKAKSRIIGISIETRPDFINIKEIKRLRNLGITKIELGVQSIYDDVLKINKRGHLVISTIKATQLLKDAGFKVSYQMMPNLLGSSFKRDIKMFKEIFSNPDFKPDFLKIYPLAMVEKSPLYKSPLRKKLKIYSKKELIKLLIEIKKQVPFWIRIERIIRDIPSKNVLKGGARVSNLREIVQKEMKKRGLMCKCIRCREIKENYNEKERIYLFKQNYKASKGEEIFLSYENKKRNKLYSLLRLRITPNAFLPVLKNSAIIRELHTYGQATPINQNKKQKHKSMVQHKGLGKKLIKEAEKIAKKDFGLKKIAVISGVGVRPYYKKLGYKLKDTYMVKNL